jgi:hypothetical protein
MRMRTPLALLAANTLQQHRSVNKTALYTYAALHVGAPVDLDNLASNVAGPGAS